MGYQQSVFETKYFLDMSRKYLPFSSKEEELELRRRALASGDVRGIADEMVLRHATLAAKVASRWAWAIPPEDALSIAVTALYTAFSRFDFAGWPLIRFETVAYPIVKTALSRAVKLYMSSVDSRSVSMDETVQGADGDEIPAGESPSVLSKLAPEVKESMSRGAEGPDLLRWVTGLIRIGGGSLATKEIELIMSRLNTAGPGETGVSRQMNANRLARARRHLVEGIRRTVSNAFASAGVSPRTAALSISAAADELLTEAFRRRFSGGKPVAASSWKRPGKTKKELLLHMKIARQVLRKQRKRRSDAGKRRHRAA